MCLDDQILNTYLDGELAEPWKSQVEEHLSYCAGCRNRYANLERLRNTVRAAALTPDEIRSHQDRVLSMIEKNYLNKKKPSFFKKTLKFSVWQTLGAAAAFVLVFAGAWAVFGNRSGNSIAVPEINPAVDINNITPVRASDSSASRSLESYSLDEILKSLDARGYDVDIRLKSIKPVSFDSPAQAPAEDKALLSYTDGTVVTSDGVARDPDGNILATGLTVLDGDLVLTSDGSVLFSDLTVDR